MGRAIALACVGGMGCGAALAARLAYAEIRFRQDTPAAVIRAAGLDRFAPPAGYFERLADLDPEHAEHWRTAALDANPRLSSTWITRGLASERDGHIDQAERDVLEAARVDHEYLPAWTLANFYFRRQGSGPSPEQSRVQFWTWARRAADLTYDDFRPLLALAHAVEPDPLVALNRLGGSGPLLRADLDYLTARGQFDDAQQVARFLLIRPAAAAAGVSDAPRVLALAERQIQAGNAAYALELWNAVSATLRYQSLDPEHGPVLANGDLLHSPNGIAFDWRLPRSEGAMVAWRPSQLTFSLSGDQPESCALLEQIVAITGARRYRLSFEYFTVGLASPTGIVWDLDGNEGRALEPSGAWLSAATVLRAANKKPAGSGLSRLRLLYRREPGSVRMPGQMGLRHLRMEVL
ncbi:MAG TPA: hypothetical protein VGG72_26775 [Bryobacteraceae bacterium]